MAIELEITDVAFGGKGVGRANGKTVFVPLAIDGEKVAVRIVREQKKFSEAELERIDLPSPHRVEPRCPYFGSCGGCAYQHIDYEHQLALKWRQLKETLRRIGGIADAPMRPFIPSPIEYEYRNRITVHARDGVVGFFRRESNRLLDIKQCPIAQPAVNAQLADLRAGRAREGHYTLRAHDGPRVFQQANDAVAASLLDLVERMTPSSADTLIDVYCGAGFFARRLRNKFERVIGIDWDVHAIADARASSEPKEEYIAAEVDEAFAEILGRLDPQTCTVILDPPAAGLSEAVRTTLNERQPTRLIYVSCNPGTLARDLAALKNRFELLSVTPLDMFPQTAEIEAVAELHAGGSSP